MLELLRERLAELLEVRLAAAFGSVARGEERPGSSARAESSSRPSANPSCLPGHPFDLHVLGLDSA